MTCPRVTTGPWQSLPGCPLHYRPSTPNALAGRTGSARQQRDAARRPTCAQASPSRATPDLFETEVDGSWVIAPPQGRPKGTVHFLGGAFAGASPQLIYPLLLQLLARAGYTVISTPYAVTFKHVVCAGAVHKRFTTCVDTLRQTGRGYMVPDDRPIHGIGHSNGALLHLLIGSIYAPASASNILISFNNKQVKDAIPLSLGPIQSAVAQLRTQPWLSGIPSADGLITGAMGALSQSGLMLDERALRSVAPALDQLYSVFNEGASAWDYLIGHGTVQVGDGTVEFEPTPAESRSLIGSAYRVPYSLLVRFENDAIDETPEMAQILGSANPAGTTSISLPGTHITPCGGDVAWQVGRSFSPVDAVALGVKAVVQADIRRLGDRLIGWLDGHK